MTLRTFLRKNPSCELCNNSAKETVANCKTPFAVYYSQTSCFSFHATQHFPIIIILLYIAMGGKFFILCGDTFRQNLVCLVCKDSSHTLFTVNEITFNSNSDIETQVKMSLKFITYCYT